MVELRHIEAATEGLNALFKNENVGSDKKIQKYLQQLSAGLDDARKDDHVAFKKSLAKFNLRYANALKKLAE